MVSEMAHDTLTSQQRVAYKHLAKHGSSLKEWMAAQRAEGASYDTIGRELWAVTGGEVAISYQTVKRWLIDLDLLEEAAS
jgi:hypothetical protein